MSNTYEFMPLIKMRRVQERERRLEEEALCEALTSGTSNAVHAAWLTYAAWWRGWAIKWGADKSKNEFAIAMRQEALREGRVRVRDARYRRIFER